MTRSSSKYVGLTLVVVGAVQAGACVGEPELDVGVSVAPLTAGVVDVLITAKGPAIADGRTDYVGTLIPASGDRATASLLLPEGPTVFYGYSFQQLGTLDYRVRDTCLAQARVQGGHATRVALPCAAYPAGGPGVAAVSRLIVSADYELDAWDLDAGSLDGSNMSLVSVYGAAAGAPVDLWLNEGYMGCFPTPRPSPWPEVATWTNHCQGTTDEDGNISFYLVAKPGEAGRTTTGYAEVTGGVDSEIYSFVQRVAGEARVQVTAR